MIKWKMSRRIRNIISLHKILEFKETTWHLRWHILEMYARQFSKKYIYIRIKMCCTKQLSKLSCGIGLKANLNGSEIRVWKAILRFSTQRKKWKYWAFYSKKDLFTSVNWETTEVFLLFLHQVKWDTWLWTRKNCKNREKNRKLQPTHSLRTLL